MRKQQNRSLLSVIKALQHGRAWRKTAYFELLPLLLSGSLLAQPNTAVNAKPDAYDTLVSQHCEYAKPFVSKANEFVETNVFNAALASIKRQTEIGPGREYIIAFGRGSLDSVRMSPIAQGNRSNGSIPQITNPFADLHNHPRNTPPSSGDLYGLMENALKNGEYNTRYVITGGGTMYAFVVIDTNAVRRFITKYPSQQVKGYSPLFPDDLLHEYREIQQRYGIAEEYAMAYMLHCYQTGVILLKANAYGKFVLLHTEASGSGEEKKFVGVFCE